MEHIYLFSDGQKENYCWACRFDELDRGPVSPARKKDFRLLYFGLRAGLTPRVGSVTSRRFTQSVYTGCMVLNLATRNNNRDADGELGGGVTRIF